VRGGGKQEILIIHSFGLEGKRRKRMGFPPGVIIQQKDEEKKKNWLWGEAEDKERLEIWGVLEFERLVGIRKKQGGQRKSQWANGRMGSMTGLVEHRRGNYVATAGPSTRWNCWGDEERFPKGKSTGRNRFHELEKERGNFGCDKTPHGEETKTNFGLIG